MKLILIAVMLVISMVTLSAGAAPTAKKAPKIPAVATVFECSTCHMAFSAADAKKDHYQDPMDGGKLLPLKPGQKTSL